jgi:peroxiredoxin Q/BCP
LIARQTLRDFGLALILVCAMFATESTAASPPPGSAAPEFTLPDADGKTYRLADWRGKWLVLYFYPRDHTPGCTTEAANFRDRQSEFSALNAAIVGVSLDDGTAHRSFAAQQRLPFTLLSDIGGVTAERYGALMNLGVIKMAKRHTFLIDPDGRIAKSYLSVDPDRHAEELLGDLRRLKAN